MEHIEYLYDPHNYKTNSNKHQLYRTGLFNRYEGLFVTNNFQKISLTNEQLLLQKQLFTLDCIIVAVTSICENHM